MSYFWKLFKTVFALSFSTMLIYRGNVIFFFIFETIFLATNFAIAGVGIHLAGGSIMGWDADQMYLLTAFNAFTHQFFLVFMIGPLFSISYDVATGKMDYILLKPLPSLLSVFAAHEFVISNIPNLFISMGVFMFYATKFSVSFDTVLFFLVAAILAVTMRACFAVLTIAPSFFTEKLTDGENAFWNVMALTKNPTAVFPRVFQWIFSTVFPIAIVSSFPAEVLLGKNFAVPGLLTIGLSAFFVIFTLYFFKFCLKHYKSTNAGF